MFSSLPQLAQGFHQLADMVNHRTYYSIPHVGDYKFSAQSTDFHGWLKCDGRLLNVAEFPVLYDVIGTSFGDDGEGTFALPNVRGRVPGAIGISTASNHVLGQEIGAETHTLITDEMPAHTHTITDPGHIHSGDTYRTGTQGVTDGFSSAADEGTDTDNVNSATTGITINSTGGGLPHNNMQPTVYIGSMFIFCGVQSIGVDPIEV